MRIGIFGGSFDPPHLGHKKTAYEFIERLNLDRLIVIPTNIPPHKAFNGTDGHYRLAMTKMLFFERNDITVSDMEINRAGKSYTCETVGELSKKFPKDDLFFLIGSDMLLTFHEWKNPIDILKCVKICAVTREKSVSTQQLVEYVDKHFSQYRDRFVICDFCPIEINSSQVRYAVKNGMSTDGMITEQINRYIIEKELYI